jgi:hypothetical protein
MQYSKGTCTVSYGSAIVVASADADWSDALYALQYGNPVLFSLIGIPEIPRQVISAQSSGTSASGYWELTLAMPWSGETQVGAKYILHKDFTINYGLALATAGERQWDQLISRNMVIIDANMAIGGNALQAGIKTSIAPNKTLHHAGILTVPEGATLDIQAGGVVEVS